MRFIIVNRKLEVLAFPVTSRTVEFVPLSHCMRGFAVEVDFATRAGAQRCADMHGGSVALAIHDEITVEFDAAELVDCKTNTVLQEDFTNVESRIAHFMRNSAL